MADIDNLWRLEIDEQSDALLSLEFVQEMLPRVIDDKRYWKWVIIGLHNALQGFMVLALKGTASFNVWKEQHRQAWLNAHENDQIYTGTRHLDRFSYLYSGIQSDRMKMHTNSKALVPTEAQSDSVTKLNELRNDFIHFTPKTWVIYSQGLPDLVENVLAVISFLIRGSNNIFWHEEADEAQAKSLVAQLRETNTSVKVAYQNAS